MTPTIAGVLLGRERRMVNKFRLAAATTPARARTLGELGVAEGIALNRLQHRAVIRQTAADRYYLDEPSWEAVRRSRRRAVHFTWVLALVVLLALLFARTALT